MFKKEGGVIINFKCVIFNVFVYKIFIVGYECVVFKIIGDVFLRFSVCLIV